jgi:hypothetical protein
MNFGQKSPERDFGKRGIFGRVPGPHRRGPLDAARMACDGPGATNCLAPGLGYGPDEFGRHRASQALLARRPPGRRLAGRRVEIEIADRVRGAGQELADLGVSEAHGQGAVMGTAMTDRHRDWRGGHEQGHPAGPRPHRGIDRHRAALMRWHRYWRGGTGEGHPGVRRPHQQSAARSPDARGHPVPCKADTRFRAGRGFLRGNLANSQGWRGASGRFYGALDTRPSVHCCSKADTWTQLRTLLRAVAARVGAPAAKRSCRCRRGRMPTPGESSPRSRRCASRAQTGARSEDARHATMSQSAHQRCSFRGEAMPATWSFRLVPLRFRNLHAPSSFTRVGLLGFAG